MSIAPADPILVPFGEGSVFLRSFGDEFYGRLETLDGYTVLTDPEGGITYARVDDGRFVSTGVSIVKSPPPGIPKHLQEDPIQRRESFDEVFRTMREESLLETYGPDAGLLRGRKRSIGNVRGLTIIVEFSDTTAAATRAQVDDLLNLPGYSRGGNLGSVRDYFLTMSSGKLDYQNDVVGPVRLPHPKMYYNYTLLVDDALDAAIEQEGLDLGRYATRLPNEPHAIVDAINFLYAGESVYLRPGNLWPHNSRRTRTYGDVQTGLYMLTGLGEFASSLGIGTICHENGHLLCRFPDIYDYGTRDDDSGHSEGVGRYCLMGSGNHLAEGRVPAPICGYLRKLAGWVDTEVELESGKQYDLHHGDYSTIHVHRTAKPTEYFILENRSRQGFDRYLPSNGLAVMHCDIYGSNEWQDGTPLRHYQCALLQADGRRDLEQDRNRGDADDLFASRPGMFLNADTVPSSRDWSGADSGLTLRDLGAAGEVMNVGTGDAPTPTEDTAETWPRIEIPDDDPGGVAVTLDLPVGARANTIEVSVEILHSWRGDLTVELTSPSGETATLRDGGGGSADDLIETWSSDSHAALEGLTGPDGAGAWTLKVIDTAARDVGTLEYVRIACR